MPAPDANYASALAVANRFLQAWQTQNPEDGLLLLTDAAKSRVSEEQIQDFFEHGSSAAYEIARGRTLGSGRYSFPVVLFGVAERGTSARPHFSHIVVIRATDNEWVVDRLPLGSSTSRSGRTRRPPRREQSHVDPDAPVRIAP